MDLVVAHVQVEVPARRPRDVGVLPHDIVGEDDLVADGGHGRQVGAQRHRGELRVLRVPHALVGVLHRVGLHLEAHDARAREGVRPVVLHDEAQVVVHVRSAGLRARNVLAADESQTKPAVVHVLLGAIRHLCYHLGRSRQVVHDHMDAVVHSHLVDQVGLLRPVQLAHAAHLELRLAHADLIGRVLDDSAMQHLPQVLRHAYLALVRLAERQAVVVVRQVRLRRREFVHPDVDLVALLVLLGCHAREVEGASPREGLRVARVCTQARGQSMPGGEMPTASGARRGARRRGLRGQGATLLCVLELARGRLRALPACCGQARCSAGQRAARASGTRRRRAHRRGLGRAPAARSQAEFAWRPRGILFSGGTRSLAKKCEGVPPDALLASRGAPVSWCYASGGFRTVRYADKRSTTVALIGRARRTKVASPSPAARVGH